MGGFGGFGEFDGFGGFGGFGRFGRFGRFGGCVGRGDLYDGVWFRGENISSRRGRGAVAESAGYEGVGELARAADAGVVSFAGGNKKRRGLGNSRVG